MRNFTVNKCERMKIGRNCGIVGICCNAILFFGKQIVGISCGSMSIQADAFNNLADSISFVITMVGFKLAGKPADKEHPYGHARFEYLASLFVSILIVLFGFEFLVNSINKILHPVKIEFSVWLFVILSLSILLKLFLMIFMSYVGNRIESTTLKLTAVDCRNDMIVTSIIIVSAVIEKLLDYKIDGIVGTFVSIFIVVNGMSLLRKTISRLLGEGATEELEKEIVMYISTSPMILACHELLIHDYGPGKLYASIHVEMDSKMDAMKSHQIIDDLEQECFEKFGTYLTIHCDPIEVQM